MIAEGVASEGTGELHLESALQILVQAADFLSPLGPHPAIAALPRLQGKLRASHELYLAKTTRAPPRTEVLMSAANELSKSAASLRIILRSAKLPPELLSSVDSNTRVHSAGERNKGLLGGEKEIGIIGKTAAKKGEPGKGKDNPSKGGSKHDIGSSKKDNASEDDLTGAKDGSQAGFRNDVSYTCTPLGREYALVQLEEASLRRMLGRLQGEHLSDILAGIAMAKYKTDPVQKFLESSLPEGHPTPETMALPGVQEALLLAGSSLEILKTSAPGLTPLAFSGEGEALAMLAMRAGFADEAWSGNTQPLPVTLLRPVSAGDAPSEVGKKAKQLSGKKGGAKPTKKKAAVPVEEDVTPAPAPVLSMEEEFNLLAQARYKLDLAIASGIKEGCWDAVAAASFALAEIVGGTDSPVAAGALMLHQSCRARKRLEVILRTAMAPSDRHRIFLDRLNTCQGAVSGLHTLDPCMLERGDVGTILGVSRNIGGSGGSVAGGGTGNSFPPVLTARKFLNESLEAWRRLDCGQPTDECLKALPPGVAVLSLQVSPDGSTLYGAGHCDGTSTLGSLMDAGEPRSSAEELGESMKPTSAAVWRHEMLPRERSLLMTLKGNMSSLEGAISRYCLDYSDEAGESGDFLPPTLPP
ncbi:unnamed protein product, partial [Choristocarpus tenellus]